MSNRILLLEHHDVITKEALEKLAETIVAELIKKFPTQLKADLNLFINDTKFGCYTAPDPAGNQHILVLGGTMENLKVWQAFAEGYEKGYIGGRWKL